MPCIVLAIIAVLLAVAGPLITWAYTDGSLVLTLGVSGLIAGTVVLAVLAVWRLGVRRFLRYGIEVLLISCLTFTVAALGGCPQWTWVVLECGVGLAVVFWMLRMLEERRLSYVKTPLNVLLVLLLLYVFFQLLPVPAALLSGLQVNTLRVHTEGPPNVPALAQKSPPTQGMWSVSLCRARTRAHLSLYAAYVGFFLVFINNVTSRQQFGRMLGTVLALGAFVAVSGFTTARQDDPSYYRRWAVGSGGENPAVLNRNANPELSAGYGVWDGVQEVPLERAAPAETPVETDATREEAEARARVDWYVPKTFGGDLFGGFPRSDSAVVAMVMVLCVALGVIFAYLRTRRSEWGRSGGLLYTREGNITLLVVFAALLLVSGVVISGSRGGLALMFLTVPVLIVLIAFLRHWLAGAVTLLLSPLVVVLLVVIIVLGSVLVTEGFGGLGSARLWLHPEDAVREKAELSLNFWNEEVRVLGRRAAWRIFGHFPLFGTGLGTFSNVYPNYLETGPILYFAYSDGVQWLAETGLAGGLLALAILLAGAWTVIVGLVRLRDPFFRVLLLGAATGCVVFLGYGLVDFPLYVPGVTILFVALSGVCVILGRDQIARYEEEDFIF